MAKWVCSRCSTVNDTPAPVCVQCGASSWESPTIAPHIGQQCTPREVNSSGLLEIPPKVLRYFPEIIPATFVCLASPFVTFRLLSDGYLLHAIAVLLAFSCCIYLFFLAHRKDCYLAVEAVILGSLGILPCLYQTLPSGYTVFK